MIAGALDTSATAVGLGAIHEKDACVILGTTCASEIVMRKEDCRFGAENSRYEKHPIEELYVELQPTLNGTPNIDWMLENIAKTKDFDEIDRIVDSVPVGCGGVVYHPYISVAGERGALLSPLRQSQLLWHQSGDYEEPAHPGRVRGHQPLHTGLPSEHRQGRQYPPGRGRRQEPGLGSDDRGRHGEKGDDPGGARSWEPRAWPSSRA